LQRFEATALPLGASEQPAIGIDTSKRRITTSIAVKSEVATVLVLAAAGFTGDIAGASTDEAGFTKIFLAAITGIRIGLTDRRGVTFITIAAVLVHVAAGTTRVVIAYVTCGAVRAYGAWCFLT
jgi:hypothetical protein